MSDPFRFFGALLAPGGSGVTSNCRFFLYSLSFMSTCFAPGSFFLGRGFSRQIQRLFPAFRGLFQAFLQRSPDVNHRRPLCARSGGDAASFLSCFDQSAKPRLKFIVIFLELELFGEIINELIGQLYFLWRELHVVSLAVSGRFADFVGKVHGMKSDAVVVRPEENGVL